mmetsp:Transcript_67044/g.216167  ORF Transcript_67044/g.216167 Transcript_67044/m.216167 type:complete len:220 (+) Transcript_67044:900-1559(+)
MARPVFTSNAKRQRISRTIPPDRGCVLAASTLRNCAACRRSFNNSSIPPVGCGTLDPWPAQPWRSKASRSSRAPGRVLSSLRRVANRPASAVLLWLMQLDCSNSRIASSSSGDWASCDCSGLALAVRAVVAASSTPQRCGSLVQSSSTRAAPATSSCAEPQVADSEMPGTSSLSRPSLASEVPSGEPSLAGCGSRSPVGAEGRCGGAGRGAGAGGRAGT